MSIEMWPMVIQAAIWGVLMTAVMRWVSASRGAPRPADQRLLLRQPISILVIGLTGFVFFAGLAVVSNTVGKNASTSLWTTGTFLFFAGWSAVLVAEWLRVRHEVTPEGLRYAPLWRRRGFVPWHEVQALSYSPAMKWFRLRTQAGVTVRLPATLMGLPAFAEQVLAAVPADRIDAAALPLLRETAAGRPPAVWG